MRLKKEVIKDIMPKGKPKIKPIKIEVQREDVPCECEIKEKSIEQIELEALETARDIMLARNLTRLGDITALIEVYKKQLK